MTQYSRKRPRSCEDEACELMPISKRINDLHIRSGFPETDSSIADSKSNAQAQNSIPNIHMTDLSKEPFGKSSNFHCTYAPELSVAQNPYYYHVNAVLFEAHIQRLQRMSRVMS